MATLARSPALTIPYLECERASPARDMSPRIAVEAIICHRHKAAMKAANRGSTAPLLDIAALAELLNVGTSVVALAGTGPCRELAQLVIVDASSPLDLVTRIAS